MAVTTAPPAAPPPAALPPGATGPRHLLSVTALLLGVSTMMAAAGIVAAYLNVRALTSGWPARGVELDNYLGTTMTLTLLPSAVTVEWAVYALRRGNRRQTITALLITLGLGLAFLNLLWYTASQAGFGPADHNYGVLFYALIAVVAAATGIGVGFLVVALLRVVGGQATYGAADVPRAAAWYWHAVGVTWLLCFFALYVQQHK